jgi:hypothetical protein
VFSVRQRRSILLLGFAAGGAHVLPSLELLREPLLQLVRQQDAIARELRESRQQGSRQQDEIARELRESRQQGSRQQDALVNELRVTNTYLRNSACWQFKYTSSQATQHRDPWFKQALIEVRSFQCCKPSPTQIDIASCPVHLNRLCWLCQQSQAGSNMHCSKPLPIKQSSVQLPRTLEDSRVMQW